MIMMSVLHVVKKWMIVNVMFAVIAKLILVNAVRLLNRALVAVGMMSPIVIATKRFKRELSQTYLP